MSFRLNNENLAFRNIDDEYENEIPGTRRIIQRLRRFSTKSSIKSSHSADSNESPDDNSNSNKNSSSKNSKKRSLKKID
jgi:hypothetical protein